jgi:hypothetical protein
MSILYKVPLNRRKLTTNEVSMASINNRPLNVCLHNIIWKYLQSRGARVYDLHQWGGVTDICIGMDYDFLQLKYLEQEMHGSSLHLYTSCLILCSFVFVQ